MSKRSISSLPRSLSPTLPLSLSKSTIYQIYHLSKCNSQNPFLKRLFRKPFFGNDFLESILSKHFSPNPLMQAIFSKRFSRNPSLEIHFPTSVSSPQKCIIPYLHTYLSPSFNPSPPLPHKGARTPRPPQPLPPLRSRHGRHPHRGSHQIVHLCLSTCPQRHKRAQNN